LLLFFKKEDFPSLPSLSRGITYAFFRCFERCECSKIE